MSTNNNDLFDKARYWASCRFLRAPLGMYAAVWAALVFLALVIDQVIDFTTILGAFLIAFMGIQIGYRVIYLRMIQGDKTALKYQGYFERPDQAKRDAAFAARMGKYSHQPGSNGAPLPEPADDPPVQSQ